MTDRRLVAKRDVFPIEPGHTHAVRPDNEGHPPPHGCRLVPCHHLVPPDGTQQWLVVFNDPELIGKVNGTTPGWTYHPTGGWTDSKGVVHVLRIEWANPGEVTTGVSMVDRGTATAEFPEYTWNDPAPH